jgi:Tol biopolymer transport system component
VLTTSSALLAPAAQTATPSIVFSSTRDGNAELYAVTLPGTKTPSVASRLTKLSTAEVDPATSPSGSRIAFASKANGDFNIHIASNKPGATSVPITGSTAADVDPT